MSLALADVDGDGDLDLYVANYRSDSLLDQAGTRFSYRMVNGQPVLQAVNGRPVTESDLVGRFTSVLTAEGRLDRVENIPVVPGHVSYSLTGRASPGAGPPNATYRS